MEFEFTLKLCFKTQNTSENFKFQQLNLKKNSSNCLNIVKQIPKNHLKSFFIYSQFPTLHHETAKGPCPYPCPSLFTLHRTLLMFHLFFIAQYTSNPETILHAIENWVNTETTAERNTKYSHFKTPIEESAAFSADIFP